MGVNGSSQHGQELTLLLLRNVSIGFETVFSTNYDHMWSFHAFVSLVSPGSMAEPVWASRGRCGG